MSGLAIEDDEGIVHWAPFGDWSDDHMRELLEDETDINAWGVMCEAYDESSRRPKLVKGIDTSPNKVTCMFCMVVMDDLDG